MGGWAPYVSSMGMFKSSTNMTWGENFITWMIAYDKLRIQGSHELIQVISQLTDFVGSNMQMKKSQNWYHT